MWRGSGGGAEGRRGGSSDHCTAISEQAQGVIDLKGISWRIRGKKRSLRGSGLTRSIGRKLIAIVCGQTDVANSGTFAPLISDTSAQFV